MAANTFNPTSLETEERGSLWVEVHCGVCVDLRDYREHPGLKTTSSTTTNQVLLECRKEKEAEK